MNLLRGSIPASEFSQGDRVSMHPATDAWMMGDRYGDVVAVGRKVIRVRMDRSGRLRRVEPNNLMHI
jgi:hypothetical protein